MADEFGKVEGYNKGTNPSYFPTDTDGKLVPVYNDAGRFTGQYQKNARIAVDALLTETTGDLTEIDQTQSALERIESILTTSEGISNAEQLREATDVMRRMVDAANLHKPVLLVDIFNEPSPGNDTDFNGAAVDLRGTGVCQLAISVVLGTASVFNVYRQRAPGALTGFTDGIMISASLSAGDVRNFSLLVSPLDLITFRVETTGVINQLLVYGMKTIS